MQNLQSSSTYFEPTQSLLENSGNSEFRNPESKKVNRFFRHWVRDLLLFVRQMVNISPAATEDRVVQYQFGLISAIIFPCIMALPVVIIYLLMPIDSGIHLDSSSNGIYYTSFPLTILLQNIPIAILTQLRYQKLVLSNHLLLHLQISVHLQFILLFFAPLISYVNHTGFVPLLFMIIGILSILYRVFTVNGVLNARDNFLDLMFIMFSTLIGFSIIFLIFH